ncbi:MAG: hypothetical protein AAGE88_24730 [Actinomycetota bacterium]
MIDDTPGLDLEELLNPEEQQRFRKLCLDTSPEELTQLPDVVELHLDQIRENQGANTDVETAEAIGKALLGLLAGTPAVDFTTEERSLIRGAVEYFLLADDAAGDLDEVLGLDDDARVVNSVLQRIGRTDHLIELN